MLTNVSGEVREGAIAAKSFDLLPNSGNRIGYFELKEPWSFFVMLLLSYMTQAYVGRVNMLAYAGDDTF